MQALLGRARLAELRHEPRRALAALNEAVVKHAWFAPAFAEKARLALAVHGWPEALEATAQLQQMDAQNVDAFALLGALELSLLQFECLWCLYVRKVQFCADLWVHCV